jgi:predicted nucleic acid-binding protein
VRQGLRGTISLVISKLVLTEATKNLSQKAPQALPLFKQFLNTIPFEVISPGTRAIEDAASYTELKDAPIIAAAKTAHVDYLVSLDRRHFVGIDAVQKNSGLATALPDEFLSYLRRQKVAHKQAA